MVGESNATKIKLFDSGEQQNFLNVMLVSRDSEKSLYQTFRMFKSLEDEIDCSFFYVFVENGSQDHTRDLMEQFLQSREGILCTPENDFIMDYLERPERIAHARNSGIKFLKTNAKWTLVVDNDVYFNTESLVELFNQNPTANGYAKVCSFGEQAALNEQTQNLLMTGHYYDTWAFTIKADDKDFRSYWPHCIFEDCPFCKHLNHHKKIKKQGVIEVGSAFGGFAIIDTMGMLTEGVRYFSAHVDNSSILERRITCEHVPFCINLSEKTGKKIVIATNSRVFRHEGEVLEMR